MKRLGRFRKLELFLCCSVYAFYIAYGFLKIFQLRDKILLTPKLKFSSGWKWLGRPRDDSNDDFETFNVYVQTAWKWIVVHMIVSTTLRLKLPALQYHGYAAVSFLAAFNMIHIMSFTIMVCQILTFHFVIKWMPKYAELVLGIFWMTFVNCIKKSDYVFDTLGYTQFYMLIVTLSWSLLRGCSFAFACNEKPAENHSIIRLTGYVMYLPCLVFGPLISYKRFLEQHRSNFQLKENSKAFLQQLLIIAIYWFLFQFATHFFYMNYMGNDLDAVIKMGPVFWQQSVGYFIGIHFFMCYVIIYGFGIALANFDGISTPGKPRCIACVHFYSEMWKVFDAGLYEFLFQHIYQRLCEKTSTQMRKILATTATFVFIYVWHGCYENIFVWSALNLSCLLAEKTYHAIIASPKYRRLVMPYLGPSGTRRLNILLGTQIFIPAAYSSLYFTASEDVGAYLMGSAYRNGILNYHLLTICGYCYFQCSEMFVKKSRLD